MGKTTSREVNEESLSDEQFERKYFNATYSSYSGASLRKSNPAADNKCEPYDPNSYRSVVGLIPGVLRLLSFLVAPYSFAFAFCYISVYAWLFGISVEILKDSSILITCAITCIVFGSVLLIYYTYPVMSPIRTGKRGINPFGAHNRSGLYFSDKSPEMRDVLKGCPTLLSKEVARGALPLWNEDGSLKDTLEPTPWIFTGDFRTLLPFIAFTPDKANYIRRWVRVPLCDGPLCDLRHDDGASKYEAVALDWLPPKKILASSPSSSARSHTSQPNVAVLILAGLTGGSEEGYILDAVSAVHAHGWHAFVMLGRGLGGTPCESDAFFHGARTSDLVASAELLRECLPSHTKIGVVGISMGGIIVLNAFAKGELEGLADCGACLGGTMDTHRNRYFKHSRDVWQPLLSQGLKESFAAQVGGMRRMEARIGKDARQKLDEVMNVSDFDRDIVKPLNRFWHQEHYYVDMSPPLQEYRNIKVPFLIVNAQEDPILHVDSIPIEVIQKGDITPNIVALITDTGGHVGWPVGMFPWQHRWVFQNTLLCEFVMSVSSVFSHTTTTTTTTPVTSPVKRPLHIRTPPPHMKPDHSSEKAKTRKDKDE